VTLGDLAALPPADLAARLGQPGIALQRLARGLDWQPLVPIVDEVRFEASFDLEWPVEELQPLSFVLTRLLDPLSAALARADRGAAAIDTTLTLVMLRVEADGTRVRETHVRRLELPAPMRDARVLRTLILLDLESHPPQAGIDRVSVRLHPTPGRIVQFSLLERAGPQPETIATLTSRLTALMGEGRVGSPVVLDSHAPDCLALTAFSPMSEGDQAPEACDVRRNAVPVLRRFRIPVAARVVIDGERPVQVTTDRLGIRGGAVQQWAGPWRGSGGWWIPPHRDAGAGWDRDEYDVVLADGAAYRICRDRHDDLWLIEGILD
jgi:protein ImuB